MMLLYQHLIQPVSNNSQKKKKKKRGRSDSALVLKDMLDTAMKYCLVQISIIHLFLK